MVCRRYWMVVSGQVVLEAHIHHLGIEGGWSRRMYRFRLVGRKLAPSSKVCSIAQSHCRFEERCRRFAISKCRRWAGLTAACSLSQCDALPALPLQPCHEFQIRYTAARRAFKSYLKTDGIKTYRNSIQSIYSAKKSGNAFD